MPFALASSQLRRASHNVADTSPATARPSSSTRSGKFERSGAATGVTVKSMRRSPRRMSLRYTGAIFERGGPATSESLMNARTIRSLLRSATDSRSSADTETKPAITPIPRDAVRTECSSRRPSGSTACASTKPSSRTPVGLVAVSAAVLCTSSRAHPCMDLTTAGGTAASVVTRSVVPVESNQRIRSIPTVSMVNRSIIVLQNGASGKVVSAYNPTRARARSATRN